MRSLIIAAPLALLVAGAAMAQTTEPVTPNPVEGPDAPATTSTTSPDTPATSTTPGTTSVEPAPMDSTSPAPTRLYESSGAVTTRTVTNGPVADTPENRAKYGSPMSRAGKRTAPAGN